MIGGYYLLQLFLMLLLVGGMAVLSLWLYKKLQPGGMPFGRRESAVRVIDAVPMGPFSRLAVVEFAGRRFLIAVSRGRVDTIAETEAPKFSLPDE